MSNLKKEAILEGLLFVVGDDGLTLSQVQDILEVNNEEAKELVSLLRKEYEKDDRGITINFLGDTLKLTTKKEHKDYYEKLLENPDTNILSQAALETLAIIAYNEPITRVEIDELRGVSTSHIVRKLSAKGLIKEVGKSDLPGRPILYKTTSDFLDYFGLSSKDELPKLDDISIEENKETDLFMTNKGEEEIEIID
ncbi:MAG: SMC-Scp complex subunit ScpB [Firmicutes bacterium]|nr:SMC-Scp complex subunit ScpB [Bacillota bacterium]